MIEVSRTKINGTLYWVKEVEVIVTKWPNGWWNAFKHEVMPCWFTRRYPVEWTRKVQTVYVNYPDVMPKDMSATVMYLER